MLDDAIWNPNSLLILGKANNVEKEHFLFQLITDCESASIKRAPRNVKWMPQTEQAMNIEEWRESMKINEN